LNSVLVLEVHRQQQPFMLPKQALVKLPDEDTAYLPDVLLLNRDALPQEPLWKKASTVTQGTSVPLVVEVVSTNWRDDYGKKLVDYESLGIPEYWIVDYLGLGGRRYIGTPKRPTLSIYQLVDDEYQVSQFRGDETDSLGIVSRPIADGKYRFSSWAIGQSTLTLTWVTCTELSGKRLTWPLT
jgi:Uma2 family endonuclease